MTDKKGESKKGMKKEKKEKEEIRKKRRKKGKEVKKRKSEAKCVLRNTHFWLPQWALPNPS